MKPFKPLRFTIWTTAALILLAINASLYGPGGFMAMIGLALLIWGQNKEDSE